MRTKRVFNVKQEAFSIIYKGLSIVKNWLKPVRAPLNTAWKSIRIRSFSGPYFPALGLNTERYSISVQMREKTDQKSSEYRHFSRSEKIWLFKLENTVNKLKLIICEKTRKSKILSSVIKGIWKYHEKTFFIMVKVY